MLVPWVGMTEIEQQTSKKNTREKQYVRLRTRTVISTRIQNRYATMQASWTFFLQAKAKRRPARWRTIATADRSKNKPAENAEATGRPSTK